MKGNVIKELLNADKMIALFVMTLIKIKFIYWRSK